MAKTDQNISTEYKQLREFLLKRLLEELKESLRKELIRLYGVDPYYLTNFMDILTKPTIVEKVGKTALDVITNEIKSLFNNKNNNIDYLKFY